VVSGPFVQNFAPGWFTSTITVEPWDGTFDDYGNPQYGAPIQMSCYIEDKVKMVRNFQGDERASNTTLYIEGGPLTAHDRIILPPSFKGVNLTPPVLWVSNVNDRTGFDHSEVFL
jgi:hypothetical protein